MEVRDERTWALRDLLGIAGEPPTSVASEENTHDDQWYITKQEPVMPELVGKEVLLHVHDGQGLPTWLSIEERMALKRAIVIALRGAEPTLVWAEPVKCAAQLKLTLTDLQKKEDDPRRLVKHTLRAMPQFQNVPAQDYVSLYVEEEPRNRIYFGRCVCFFADSTGAHFLAVRWLREVPGVIVDTTTRLVRLKQSPPHVSTSYSVMPTSCILNGALILEGGGNLWALLSPREEKAYTTTNYSNIDT